jgi:hypothetical protein
MNLMSASMYWTCDRSVAASAAMTRLGCPGAPGWMMGGRGSVAEGGVAGDPGDPGDPGDNVRQDATVTAVSMIAAMRK